jgi:hypothetical protein
VVFELIRRKRNVGKLNGLFKQILVEVADTDAQHLAGVDQTVELPDLLFSRNNVIRPVQKQQVDIVGPQEVQALVYRAFELSESGSPRFGSVDLQSNVILNGACPRLSR